MTQKKKKSFSTVQEVLETYLPTYVKREKESAAEDYDKIGRELALQLAKKFEASLRR
jgi:hypothetical protein